MNSAEILFKPNMTLLTNIAQQRDEFTLVLSDALEASEENLDASFRERIANFLNASGTWYPHCIDRIRQENNDVQEVKLMRAYIISEQVDYPIVFGLSFRVAFDIEHGRGLKISEDDLSVIEYGVADVAFTRGP